ncbi:hypothetical protein M0802_011562 [Mischocyttarus mexicanus]|nr:hypothetical protein M0802_011562 [Mischocyttarus mexicanus]
MEEEEEEEEEEARDGFPSVWKAAMMATTTTTTSTTTTLACLLARSSWCTLLKVKVSRPSFSIRVTCYLVGKNKNKNKKRTVATAKHQQQQQQQQQQKQKQRGVRISGVGDSSWVGGNSITLRVRIIQNGPHFGHQQLALPYGLRPRHVAATATATATAAGAGAGAGAGIAATKVRVLASRLSKRSTQGRIRVGRGSMDEILDLSPLRESNSCTSTTTTTTTTTTRDQPGLPLIAVANLAMKKEQGRDRCTVLNYYGIVFGFGTSVIDRKKEEEIVNRQNDTHNSIRKIRHHFFYFNHCLFNLNLNYNNIIVFLITGDKFRLVLATTLREDGYPDGGEWNATDQEGGSRADSFEYVMSGKVYRIEGDEASNEPSSRL